MDIQAITKRQSPTVADLVAGRLHREAILLELANRWRAHQAPPSYADLAAIVGLTVPGVQHHAERLRKAGLVHPGFLWLTARGYARRPR